MNSTAVLALLRQVEDPELPVSIVDLGMVRDIVVDEEGHAEVTLVPTFLGCPAQLFIEDAVRHAVAGARVRWSTDRWSLDDVNDKARNTLRDLGIAVPAADGFLRCPHCDSAGIVVESDWGSTLCRKLGFCPDCRTPVDILKGPSVQSVSLSRRGADG